jgi:hypothetical protein
VYHCTAETEENRRNYALNIAHLKEEEVERFYQLEALRRQVTENDTFCRKMNELKLQSVVDRDRAETELGEFQREVSSLQGFIGDQLVGIAIMRMCVTRVFCVSLVYFVMYVCHSCILWCMCVTRVFCDVFAPCCRCELYRRLACRQCDVKLSTWCGV